MRRSCVPDPPRATRSHHVPRPHRPVRAVSRPALATLVLVGALLQSCALGGEDPRAVVDPFEPSFGPAEGRGPAGRGGDAAGGAGRGEREGRGGRDDGADRGSEGRRGGQGSGQGSGSGAAPTAPGTGSSGSGDDPSAGSGAAPATSASVTDPSGDATGVGTPAWADLVGGSLGRDGSGWTVVLDLAAAVPATTSGDRVLDLTLWVDRDGDGAIDDEVLAQLGSEGWTTAYRDPDGARYGSASGVSVTADGATVTLRLPATHLGGSRSLRWVVGAEHGSLAAMTAGTASRDTAPDAGAAAFPG